MLSEVVGSQIRNVRKERQMTLEDFSQKTGIDETYLGRVERNEINITLNTLDKIIQGLDMTIDQFFSSLNVEREVSEIDRLMEEIKNSGKSEELLEILKQMLKLIN